MPSARRVAFKALSKIYKDRSYSNLVLSDISASAEYGEMSERDRAFTRRLVKTVIRREITLDYNISLYLTHPIGKLKPQVLTLLRLGACQILFDEKTPDSAAVNETVRLAKQNGCAFAAGMINAVLRKISLNGTVLPDESDLIKRLGVEYSFPEYVVKIFVDYYGFDDTVKILSHSLEPGKIYIRKNTLRNAENDFDEKYPAVEYIDGCHILSASGDLKKNTDYLKGLFHVQDLSSQICCKVLALEPGQTVLDACASPGGKSATAAQMMNNTGLIVACDIHENRLGLIKDNMKRLGVNIVKTACLDASRDVFPVENSADRVLCDVPCSGFGVTAKKPEIKYKTAGEIENLPDLQLKILENASKYLKNDGRLVYSTCTLLPEENIGVCEKFLKNNTQFTYDEIPPELNGIRNFGTLTVLPQNYDCDGFFIAAFKYR